MALQSLNRVRRTTRRISTARRGQRRDPHLVHPHQSDQDATDHVRSTNSTSSRRRSSNPASYASRLARTRRSTSTPRSLNLGSKSLLPISRSRRLRRFRSTIRCRCFGTTTPNRGCETGEAAKTTSRCRVLDRFPREKSPRMSAPFRIRTAGGYLVSVRAAPGCSADVPSPSIRYFEPILTVSRARPFLRRALITFRPLLVFMRARNPCLFTRLRLRGR